MGNLCSKSSNKDDHFSQPGRALGSSSQSQATSAPVPQKATSSTPGRTVGGSGPAPGANDAKAAAARAAEERAAKASQSTGELSNRLQAQRKQTRKQMLNSASEQERQSRAADANTEARNYN